MSEQSERHPVPLHRARWRSRSRPPGRTAGRRTARSTPPTPPGPWAEPEKVAARGEKLIVLDMFPYPSGVGLHVGHPLGYIATDVYSRFHRMLGKNVLHALGYDAFGLPAEQYAVQTGQHPRKTTEENMTNMKRQLRRLGLGFDNRRTFATIDDDYYRWTQWIFLQIWDAWYDAEAVRADGGRGRARPISELVEEFESGRRAVARRRRPRLGRPVRDRARHGPRGPPPGLHVRGAGQLVPRPRHRALQRGGHQRGPLRARQLPGLPAQPQPVEDAHHGVCRPAGRRPRRRRLAREGQAACSATGSAGPRARASPSPSSPATGEQDGIDVFTTRPDTIFGATFMVIAPEHPLVDSLVPQGNWPEGTKDAWKGSDADASATPKEAVTAYQLAASRKGDVERQTEGKDKTGVFTGSWATNPADGRADPGLRRRLRADGLRHRRHHGGARAGHARLGVRREVRHPDRPHRPARRGPPRRRAVPRRRRRDQQRQRRASRSTGCTSPTQRRASSTSSRPRGSARGPSATASATGSSAASATGASRSPSCSTRTGWRMPSPTTSCR